MTVLIKIPILVCFAPRPIRAINPKDLLPLAVRSASDWTPHSRESQVDDAMTIVTATISIRNATPTPTNQGCER